MRKTAIVVALPMMILASIVSTVIFLKPAIDPCSQAGFSGCSHPHLPLVGES